MTWKPKGLNAQKPEGLKAWKPKGLKEPKTPWPKAWKPKGLKAKVLKRLHQSEIPNALPDCPLKIVFNNMSGLKNLVQLTLSSYYLGYYIYMQNDISKRVFMFVFLL